MEQDKALSILKTLADGVDPATGEQFSADSPYQHPDIIRALFWAVQTLSASARAEKQAKPRADGAGTNAGKPWSEEEDARLSRAFDSGRPVEQLAEAHQRSRLAIEARLVKLGKISEPPAGMRFPLKKNAAAQPQAGYQAR